jgi:hypothetical protein
MKDTRATGCWGKPKIPKLIGDELEGSKEDVPSLGKTHGFH